MRVVVVGATGNVGTSVLEALGRDDRVDSILGLAAAAGLTWLARLHPTSPDWLDLALGVPLLDTTRAREELGWEPRHGALETARELLQGLADRAGGPTPPLRVGDRRSELAAGVGGKPV